MSFKDNTGLKFVFEIGTGKAEISNPLGGRMEG